MGFSQSVRWWEDWQLRLLLLGSLFFQCFLSAAALLRKRRIPHWFRSLIWLAYQAGDIVVIYALATLFSRHRNDDDYSGSAHLDTLWAPILLLHLGGQDGITAYSVEDNENWRRHFFVAVSQITIAVYAFRKTWLLQDRRLLRAAILLFVPGVLKCLHKPWALKNATVTSIMSSSDSRLEATLDLDDEVAKKNINSLERYVQEAAEIAKVKQPQPDLGIINKDDLSDEPYHLFVDLGHPYAIRLKNLQLVAPFAGGGGEDISFYREVHDLLRSSLSRAFNRLYTKHKASFGGLLRAAVVLAAFLDIAALQKRHRVAYYARADVAVTYVVLLCTAALELVSACSGLPWPDDRVAQYNLIGYLARNRKHRGARKLARMAGFKDYLDTIWCTAPPEPSLRITVLVHKHVAGGWKDDDMNYSVETYRRFNDGRGQRTLRREGLLGSLGWSVRMPFDESVLVWHLATELCYFDHVDAGCDATRHGRVVSNYMAYLLSAKPEMLMPGARPGLLRAAYEVLKKMLDDEPVEDEVELWRTEKKPMASPPKAKDEMARRIIQKVKTGMGSPKVIRKTTSTVDLEDLVQKAWKLACELMDFAKTKEEEEPKRKAGQGEEEAELMEEEKEEAAEGEETEPTEEEAELMEEEKEEAAEGEETEPTEEEQKPKKLREEERRWLEKKNGDERMWEVIRDVWVEMICFSAGRCRGYLHAKSLGNGGEYLSYVWLLLSYMGMETTPERMQRTEVIPVEGDTGALVMKARTEEDEMEAVQQPALGQPNNLNSDTTAAVQPPVTTAPAGAKSAVVPVLGPEDNV